MAGLPGCEPRLGMAGVCQLHRDAVRRHWPEPGGRVPGLAVTDGLPGLAGALAGSIRAPAARRVHEKCMRSAWQVYGRRIRAAGP